MAPRWATWVGSLPMTATTVGVGSQELSEGGGLYVLLSVPPSAYTMSTIGVTKRDPLASPELVASLAC